MPVNEVFGKNDALTATSEPLDNAAKHSPAQMYKMSAVYGLIARLIPTEGRDYSVKFNFGENDKVSIKLEPYTQFGKVWCDYCMAALKRASSTTPPEQ